MRAILNFGMPKSGSTSLQWALYEARDTLLKQHGLAYQLGSEDELNNDTIYHLAMQNRFSDLSVSVGRKIEAAHRAGARDIVFSAERAFTIAGHPDEFSEFVNGWRGLGLATVEYVLFVRYLPSYLRSYLVQLIRNGGSYPGDAALASWVVGALQNFWSLPERVTFISFEKALNDRGLAQAFLSCIGLDVPSVVEGHKNKTPDRSLAFFAASGVECKLRAITDGVDVNSQPIDRLRIELADSFDALVYGTRDQEAINAIFKKLDASIANALDDYIDRSLSLLNHTEVQFLQLSTSSLLNSNR